MIDNLTVGVLLPSSNIFPIAKEFEKGLKQGLKPLSHEGIDVELVKEFIGGGDPKTVQTICNKLLNFDEASVVTGILSQKTTAKLTDVFAQKNTLLLLNNVGEYTPDINSLNDNIATNSMHLWRHAWALGDWGVKNFGPKGMFVGAAYDAGYSFSHLFYDGMMANGKNGIWSFSVPPFSPDTKFSQMEIIFPFLEQYQPDFIFAGFCGTETEMFLNEFIARGWHHKTKVVGLPYLLAPFKPLNADITIYTTQPFDEAPDITAQNAFNYLGLTTGQNIALAAKQATSKNEFNQLLKQRENLFYANRLFSKKDICVSIIKNDIKAGANDFVSEKIDTTPSLSIDTETLKPLIPAVATGWFNPYLCL